MIYHDLSILGMRILFTSSTFSKKNLLPRLLPSMSKPRPINCLWNYGGNGQNWSPRPQNIHHLKKKNHGSDPKKIETYLRKCQTAHLEGYQSNNSREYHGISTGIERECISNNMLYVYLYIHNIYIYMYTYMRTYYYYIYIYTSIVCVWDV